MTPIRVLVLVSAAMVQAWTWISADSALDARWWFTRWLACAAPFLIGIAASRRPRGVPFFVAALGGSAISAVLCAQRFEDGVGLLGGHVAWQIAFAACLFTTWVLLPVGIAARVRWLNAEPWCVVALMFVLFVALECTRISIYLKDEVVNQGAASGRITQTALVRVGVLYALTALALALSLTHARASSARPSSRSPRSPAA